jgi:hypothetical protein
MVIPMELVEFAPMSRPRHKKISDGIKSILKIKRTLIERKELHFRCCRVNDMMCIIALFGLVLMIIDTEFRLNEISKMSVIIIRPLISISTVILIGLVLYYRVLDSRLYATNNHIADWRVTLTVRDLLMTICEVIVCSIHPFPYIVKSSSFGGVVWLEMVLTLPSK